MNTMVMMNGDDESEQFTNLLATINFKCPLPKFPVNYLYTFLGLYQYSKTTFKAINEYALIGENGNFMRDIDIKKTVMFTGLNDDIFPNQFQSVHQQQQHDLCLVLRVLYLDNQGCEVLYFGVVPLVKHILASGGESRRPIELFCSPDRQHITDYLIHKVVCDRSEVLITKGILKRLSPEYFVNVIVKASYPKYIAVPQNNKMKNKIDVVSHSLVSMVNRDQRNEIVVDLNIANIPSSDFFQSMPSQRIDFKISLVIKFAGISSSSRSSLLNTPVIKRTLRYAAGKTYAINEVLRACVLPPPEEASQMQKKHNQSFWSDNFSIDANMIQEKILTKNSIELYLHISTVDDNPNILLSDNMILIASNKELTSDLLDSTFSHTVGITINPENTSEQVELSVTANLISSSYSSDRCINQINREGFESSESVNMLTSQFWNQASLSEISFFSIDIMNRILQYVCTKRNKDHAPYKGREMMIIDEVRVFEIFMLYASLLELDNKESSNITFHMKKSLLVKIKKGIENKNNELDISELNSPFKLVSLLETFLRDTIKRKERLSNDDKSVLLANSELPELFQGLSGCINLSIYGWHNAIKTISTIVFAKLSELHDQKIMGTKYDAFDFDELINKNLNSFRSLYTYIGRSLIPLVLLQSDNVEDDFNGILYKVIDSAQFICSKSIEKASNPYGKHLGTTLYNIALTHFLEGFLFSGFDLLPTTSKYNSIYMMAIRNIMQISHFKNCFKFSTTAFSMILFSYFARCQTKNIDATLAGGVPGDNIECKSYISYFLNLEVVVSAIKRPILEHTYRINSELFYVFVENACQILRESLPINVSTAHQALFQDLLDIMITNKDGRKWELFSLLGFHLISITRCQAKIQLHSNDTTMKGTIHDFYNCMLTLSNVSIASMVDFEVLKDAKQITIPVASPKPEECIWFLNIILLAGDTEYDCRQIVDQCIQNRFNVWNEYSNNPKLTLKEKEVLKKAFVEIFNPLSMMLSERLLALFLSSKWSKWFNPWHVFYQFELLLNSTRKSGMNVVEFLPLTKCLRICEMFSLIWSRSIKFSIVEEKLNVIKSIFYENGIIENHGMNTPSVEKDWNTFRCYFQILRKEFQLYPAWSDNDGIHAVLKTLGTDANNDILVDNNDNINASDTINLQLPSRPPQGTPSSPPPPPQKKSETTTKLKTTAIAKKAVVVTAKTKSSLSKLKSLRLARKKKAAAAAKAKQKQKKKAEEERNTTKKSPKRSSLVGFVNPLAAALEASNNNNYNNNNNDNNAGSDTKKSPKRSSLVGFVNPLAATLEASNNNNNAGSDTKKSPKRSSLVGFVNPLTSGISISANRDVFSSPPPRSPNTPTRRSVAISPEIAEAMKFARSINIFVGPDDALLLKKYLDDGEANFDCELMEKTGQIHVNVCITPTDIIITKVKEKKKKKKKESGNVLKQIPLKNVTNIQESMAPSAFTMYISSGQALYMTCKNRGVFLGCIKGFQEGDKKSPF